MKALDLIEKVCNFVVIVVMIWLVALVLGEVTGLGAGFWLEGLCVSHIAYGLVFKKGHKC